MFFLLFFYKVNRLLFFLFFFCDSPRSAGAWKPRPPPVRLRRNPRSKPRAKRPSRRSPTRCGQYVCAPSDEMHIHILCLSRQVIDSLRTRGVGTSELRQLLEDHGQDAHAGVSTLLVRNQQQSNDCNILT